MASDEDCINIRIISHCLLQVDCNGILSVFVANDGNVDCVCPLVASHGLHHLEVGAGELVLVRGQEGGHHGQWAVGVVDGLRVRPQTVNVLEIWKTGGKLQILS